MSRDGLVLDSNLLLLFVVGTASLVYIAKHRRLRAFSKPDFALLEEVVSAASRLLVTPNILTETSNLIGYIAEPARSHIYHVFGSLVRITEEQYYQSKDMIKHKEFVRLGLADVVLLEAVSESHTVLTTDLDLYLAALSRGGSALNFNHLRAAHF